MDNQSQLKTISREQRKSKSTLTITFMTGQLKIYPYGICTVNKENQSAIQYF